MLQINTGLATGAAIDGLDQALAVATVVDNLMGAVVSLGIGKEGARLYRANADSRLSDRVCSTIGPGVKPAVRHPRLYE